MGVPRVSSVTEILVASVDRVMSVVSEERTWSPSGCGSRSFGDKTEFEDKTKLNLEIKPNQLEIIILK